MLILSGLILLLILLAAGWVAFRAVSRKKEAERARSMTLDALYAAKRDMWVCTRCETLNQNSSARCAACSATRRNEGGT